MKSFLFILSSIALVVGTESVFRPYLYNPCAAVLCMYGTRCEVRGNKAVCVELPKSCDMVKCPKGQVCQETFADYSDPPLQYAECVPDPCTDYVCPAEQECYLEETLEPGKPYQCQPMCRIKTDPCSWVKCANGSTCINQNGQAICVSPKTCNDLHCPKGQYCEEVLADESNSSSLYVRCADSPCKNLCCPDGQRCCLKRRYCIRAPCNPYGTCEDVNPFWPPRSCSFTKCPAGTICREVPDQNSEFCESSRIECVEDTCEIQQ